MIPTFASGAVYGVGIISPSASLLSTGYVAGNTLAAQFLNFYLWGITAELNSVLAAGSVAQNSAVSNQVLTALQNIITGMVPSNATILAAILAATGTGYKILSSGSPYSAAAVGGAYVVTATPFTFNLPAATGSGNRIRVINGMGAVAGLITILTNNVAGIYDVMANPGNVSCFLQNVDQSGAPTFQWIELTDNVAGIWDVTGGQFCPHQSVDTDGSQYHLGNLEHLPLGNTTSRELTGAALTPAATSNWYASAIPVTGVHGIPIGAKAIRAKIILTSSPGVTGYVALRVQFSDNNSNVPSDVTAHPSAGGYTYGVGGDAITWETEIDIPLNSSGQCFMYSVQNINGSSQSVIIAASGYYMGY